jgi:hypothetical protein
MGNTGMEGEDPGRRTKRNAARDLSAQAAGVALGLRVCAFLDDRPDPSEVPRELVEHVWRKRQALRRSWNAMYPENPVYSKDNDR